MNALFEPAARSDATEAVQWYLDVAGSTVAQAFEREIDAAIQLLLRFPQTG